MFCASTWAVCVLLFHWAAKNEQMPCNLKPELIARKPNRFVDSKTCSPPQFPQLARYIIFEFQFSSLVRVILYYVFFLFAPEQTSAGMNRDLRCAIDFRYLGMASAPATTIFPHANGCHCRLRHFPQHFLFRNVMHTSILSAKRTYECVMPTLSTASPFLSLVCYIPSNGYITKI